MALLTDVSFSRMPYTPLYRQRVSLSAVSPKMSLNLDEATIPFSESPFYPSVYYLQPDQTPGGQETLDLPSQCGLQDMVYRRGRDRTLNLGTAPSIHR